MTRPVYPFSAIVGQERMKSALLLAAVDWRLGILLRGEKGAGKTTAARALAELLPPPARFVNLPIGVTEDRLLGGIDLTKTLRGQPELRLGLLSEANGGVLYVDEVNLLPDHLADLLLDAAATGIHTLEREGFSASHESRFVLMGSMNPEEGSLRPQLLDRFALVVDVTAPKEPDERREVVEHRLAYDADPAGFVDRWAAEQDQVRKRIAAARKALPSVQLSRDMLARISVLVHEHNVVSLRADLAVARSACAHAALLGTGVVSDADLDAVLPLALAHRIRSHRPPSAGSQPASLPAADSLKAREMSSSERPQQAHRFSPAPIDTPALRPRVEQGKSGVTKTREGETIGAVIGTRKSENPTELEVRSSVVEALLETGRPRPDTRHLHEKQRAPLAGCRYLFVVDSSGSHAAGERMRLVKGAAVSLIENSARRRDEIAVVAFRGGSAEVLVQPTHDVEEVRAAFEYLPTGGRTPLAHALELAKQFVNDRTLLILLTDGRANVPLLTHDPWSDALTVASQITCRVLVVNTELARNATGRAKELAASIHAECVALDDLGNGFDFPSLLGTSDETRGR